MTKKSNGEEAQTAKTPFAEFVEQMVDICGPETKERMAACAPNMSEACGSCCGMQKKTNTAEKK